MKTRPPPPPPPPECREWLQTSTRAATFLRCGHAIHEHCLRDMLSAAAGLPRCPLCAASLGPTRRNWAHMDVEVALTPMPDEYRHTWLRM
jgi:RING finger and CHY zinc finger domain-containing protein 1